MDSEKGIKLSDVSCDAVQNVCFSSRQAIPRLLTLVPLPPFTSVYSPGQNQQIKECNIHAK